MDTYYSLEGDFFPFYVRKVGSMFSCVVPTCTSIYGLKLCPANIKTCSLLMLIFQFQNKINIKLLGSFELRKIKEG